MTTEWHILDQILSGISGPLMLIIALTAVTLVAFAANSILCRIALNGHLIDPVSFTTIRLLSGVLILIPFSRLLSESKGKITGTGSWKSGLALFAYAIAFSLAYVSLTAGIGALILFGSVQVTMIASALRSGERLHWPQWLGSIIAVGGLIYLVSPGITAPSPLGALLMCLAGIAWGVYSIRGKGTTDPVAATAGNFLRSAPLAFGAMAVALPWARMQWQGIALAIASGAVASAPGYILWYRSLRGLTTTQASIVQLLVPVLAAIGGLIFLRETLSVRLVLASALILGGVALAVVRTARR